MDTNRAKNTVIIILIILNVILFYFIRLDDNAFTVTRARYTAIQNLLLRNRIALYTNIDGSDFSPRRILTMEVFPVDVLESLLIGIGTTYHRRGISEFRADPNPHIAPIELNKQVAIEISRAFLEEFEEVSGVEWGFELVGIFDAGMEVFVQYMGHFNDIPIASNLILFRINRYGIFEISSQLGRPIGFSEAAHEIYSVDEALLTLMHELILLFPGRDIRVDDYQIVYYFQPDLYVGISNASPAYMFSVVVLEPHERVTVFVAAYTNTVVTNRIERGLFTFMNRQ